MTQLDVAKLAGVSQTTVSQVLSHSATASISPETHRRVEAAALALGYQPNRTAQSLRAMRTRTVGFVIPDITNPFYPALEQAVQQVVEANGHDLLISNTDGVSAKEHACLELLSQGRVDGLIGVFFHVTARDLSPLVTSGFPIVRIETQRRQVHEWPLDNLFVDNRAAAYTATRHLLDRGHRSIAMIAAPGGPSSARIAGYERALADAGLQTLVARASDFAVEPGARAMQELLRRAARPTAVFAANDLLAVGAMMALHDAALRVPEDVAVVGFDDIPMASVVTPRLTTIRQFQDRLGRRAADMLFERLERRRVGPGRYEEQPFELIIRASS